jgi:hypothetical protein
MAERTRPIARRRPTGRPLTLCGLVFALCAILAQPFSGMRDFRLAAQEVSATAVADTNTIRVGEQFRVKVSVAGPGGFVLRNVGPADSLEGLEIVGVDSSSADGTAARTFTITAFDSGTYVVPPFAAYYRGQSDSTVRVASTLPIAVFVHGVDVDTSAEIRAIKPPLDVPLTFMEVLPWALAVIVAAGLIWLAYYYMKRRRRGESFIPAPPPRPADEIALEALRAVGSEKLWQRGKLKEYHTAVSDIVRTYIENRFGVPAMESTSDEILVASRGAGFGEGVVALLGDILLRSDLVKFAKFVPEPSQNEKSLEGAVAFVEQTRVVKVAREEPVPAEPAP